MKGWYCVTVHSTCVFDGVVRPFIALCFKERTKPRNCDVVTKRAKKQSKRRKDKDKRGRPHCEAERKEKMKDETKEPEWPRKAGSQHALGWTHKSHEYEVYMKSACVHPAVKKSSRHLGPKGP